MGNEHFSQYGWEIILEVVIGSYFESNTFYCKFYSTVDFI